MTDAILMQTLKKHGLERFDPAEAGDMFNPNLHEATFQTNVEGKEDGQVFMTQQKGFLLNGRVVRVRPILTLDPVLTTLTLLLGCQSWCSQKQLKHLRMLGSSAFGFSGMLVLASVTLGLEKALYKCPLPSVLGFMFGIAVGMVTVFCIDRADRFLLCTGTSDTLFPFSSLKRRFTLVQHPVSPPTAFLPFAGFD